MLLIPGVMDDDDIQCLTDSRARLDPLICREALKRVVDHLLAVLTHETSVLTSVSLLCIGAYCCAAFYKLEDILQQLNMTH